MTCFTLVRRARVGKTQAYVAALWRCVIDPQARGAAVNPIPGGSALRPGDDIPVIVIGGGPAGLAAAAALGAEGVPCRVLDRNERTGDSWRYLYDRLRLHTSRAKSGLPGLPIPTEYGRWVRRDDVVAYLEAYARHHHLAIQHGVTAERIDQENGKFRVSTSAGPRVAQQVVVATGYNNVPRIPAWAQGGRFTGQVVHTHDYRNPNPFRGHRVLVVGSGNSGAEIAQD